MNPFFNFKIAQQYDDYYQTALGKAVDQIEKKLVSKSLKKIPKQEMLELGCGTGHWTKFFSDNGFKVTATDVSPAMLKVAQSKNINAHFLLVNAQKLPFQESSFSVLTAITMLEFVTTPEQVVQEMHRVLQKDGWLMLAVLHKDSIIDKNKKESSVFKNARFFHKKDIEKKFHQFQIVECWQDVYLDENYVLSSNKQANPAFMVVLLQKNSKKIKDKK